MSEIVAERKVNANAKAYSYVKEIQGAFVQQGTEPTLRIIANYEVWFFDNRLFLPGEFPAKWLSIRNNLSKLARREKQLEKTSNKLEEIEKLHSSIETACKDAILEIYKDMELEPIVVPNSD